MRMVGGLQLSLTVLSAAAVLWGCSSSIEGGGERDTAGVEDVSTADVAADVASATCESNAECEGRLGDLGDCQVAVCSGGQCVAVGAKDYIACDDGSACSWGSYCFEGACAGGTAVVCNDDDPCTDDRCDEVVGGCVFSPLNGTVCDDGDPCTADDVCDLGECRGTPTDTCPCTTDGECAAYDDDSLCNGIMACRNGQCAVDPDSVVTCDTSSDTECSKTVCEDATGACVAAPVADGTACSDGNNCTQGDACAAGVCESGEYVCSDQCATDADCAQFEDGDLCNGTLACVAGQCVVDDATVITCEQPENACKQAVCEAASGMCVQENRQNGVACDDGDACTDGDVCAGGVCVGQAKSCDDGDLCTTDACADGVCSNIAVACDDGDACTADTCDPSSGECVHSSPSCDDGNPCTEDACDPTTGACGHAALDEGACDDGDECTVGDSCQAGVCRGDWNPDCGCTVDSDCAPYDDPDLCNGRLRCMDGACVVDPETIVVCSQVGLGPCEENVCAPETGDCQRQILPSGTVCDDGNACTAGDVCTGSVCAGEDTCGECASNQDCEQHDDGNLCNGTYFCSPTTLRCELDLSSVVVCEDSDDPCVEIACVPLTGSCQRTVLDDGTACDDGDACTSDDVCTNGRCRGVAMACDDGDPCTVDSCDPTTGGCASEAVSCDDGDPCTYDACDPDDGTCIHAGATGFDCDDGDPCTAGDRCESGVCMGVPLECEDGDACTIGVCSPDQGGCVFEPLDCDDGVDCTVDSCDSTLGCLHDGSGCVDVEWDCGDQIDNDDDGAVDCADEDCVDNPLCVVPCETDELEDDDMLESATETVGNDVFDALTVETEDDDWFAVPVCAGGELFLSAGFDHGDGDIDLYLYDAEGGSLSASTSTEDVEDIVWRSDVDGFVYARVTMFTPATCSSYYLSIFFDDSDCGGPGVEDCFDLMDNDGDGAVDCADPDCSGVVSQPGACTNEADLRIASTMDLEGVAATCILDEGCLANADCNSACIAELTGVSADCADCGGVAAACVVQSCFAQCTDLASAACQECIETSCYPAYEECFGRLHCAFEYYCEGGEDDDGDGLVDCADPDCEGVPPCAAAPEICDDAADNDGDGLVDCADPDCLGHPSCPVACDDDAFEDNDSAETATAVAEDAPTLSGLVSAYDDDDWFSFPVCAGAVLSVDAAFLHASGDIDLELFDESGELLGLANSSDDDEQIEWLSTIDGTVYLRVVMFDEGGCNPYDIAFAFDAADCVTIEPENCFDLADNDLDGRVDCADSDCSGVVAVEGACTNEGDLAIAGRIDVEVIGRQCILDEGCMTDVACNADCIANATGLSTGCAQCGGELAACVVSACALVCTEATAECDACIQENCYGDYEDCFGTLHCAFEFGCDDGLDDDGDGLLDCFDDDCFGQPECVVTCEDDALEDNDLFADATPVVLGERIDAVSLFGDDDLFLVDVCAGGTLSVELAFAHADADLDLYVITEQGFELASSTSSTDGESLTWTSDMDGQVAVLVALFDGGDCASYGLTIDFDDTLCGGPVDEICDNGADDDGDGLVDCADPDCLGTPSCPPTCADDSYEDNDDADTAAPLDSAVIFGQVCSQDDDWFALELVDGCTLDIGLYFVHGDGDLDLGLFDEFGQELRSSASTNDEETISHTAAYTGLHLVRVYGYAGAEGQYTLETAITCPVPEVCDNGVDDDGDGLADCDDPDCAIFPDCVVGCADDVYEDNEVYADATPFPVGTTMNDLVLADGDQDLYAIPVCEGAVVSATVEFAHADGNINAYFVSATNEVFTRAETRTDNEYVEWVADRTAEIYLLVRMHTDDACNPYWLTIDVDDSGCEGVEDCFDGADNDGDGRADCADSDCSASVTTEGACTNDWDLPIAARIDIVTLGQQCILDQGCFGDATCNSICIEAATNLSNECSSCGGELAACVVSSCLMDCADTASPACALCIDTACWPGYEECFGLLHCPLEYSCDDGADDDGDGLVDCADPDCDDIFPCTPIEPEICDDGVDNDGDGAADCLDDDCLADPSCMVPPEAVCDDGLDDDGDGLVDCEDPDCAASPACDPQPCAPDAFEDDDSLEAATGLEPGAEPVVASVDLDDDDWFAIPVCAGGQLTVTADFLHDDGDVDIYLHAVAETWLVRAWSANDNEEIIWDVVDDGTLYVRVDLFGGNGCNTYALSAQLTGCDQPLEVCDDGVDGDGDGRIDCADSDCSGAVAEHGACTNPRDIPIAATVDINAVGTYCIVDAGCFGDATCNTQCIMDETGLSMPCSTCGGQLAECTMGVCLGDCLAPDSPACAACLDANCWPAYVLCSGTLLCTLETECADGLDDDGDSLVDCLDPDCDTDPVCQF